MLGPWPNHAKLRLPNDECRHYVRHSIRIKACVFSVCNNSSNIAFATFTVDMPNNVYLLDIKIIISYMIRVNCYSGQCFRLGCNKLFSAKHCFTERHNAA